ncbi:hypothetical protein M378DRAFT_162229 [Amanita muscaria Koide BX008]|uniref:Uncharacterized protein n=1 Tax=Amanita muscaria (strain Koide BX008) TaxID=946122 RepID=A0A0C2X942_AMAMK|nr:hypothetical protein M378DRAFT_162229 [Amanita muscaria Koide BX008]
MGQGGRLYSTWFANTPDHSSCNYVIIYNMALVNSATSNGASVTSGEGEVAVDIGRMCSVLVSIF